MAVGFEVSLDHGSRDVLHTPTPTPLDRPHPPPPSHSPPTHLHMSTAVLYVLTPSSSSGQRYPGVTTTGVYGLFWGVWGWGVGQWWGSIGVGIGSDWEVEVDLTTYRPRLGPIPPPSTRRTPHVSKNNLKKPAEISRTHHARTHRTGLPFLASESNHMLLHFQPPSIRHTHTYTHVYSTPSPPPPLFFLDQTQHAPDGAAVLAREA
jgi:hypothetical protein